MTEQDLKQQIEDQVAEQLAQPPAGSYELADIPLSRCDIQFVIQVTDADTLGGALDMATLSLARYGLNSFYVQATDPDTGREWIIANGEIRDAEQFADELAKLRAATEDNDD